MSARIRHEEAKMLTDHYSEDLAKLAEEHMKHDLEPSDREVLEKAAGKVSVPAAIGTIVGLGLGVYAAFRLRKARVGMFNAFRATEKPTHVVFAGGRTGTRETSSLDHVYVLLTLRFQNLSRTSHRTSGPRVWETGPRISSSAWEVQSLVGSSDSCSAPGRRPVQSLVTPRGRSGSRQHTGGSRRIT